MNGITKIALLAAGVAAFTVPAFSSGLRRDLTFARFMWNHTTWGDFPQYVPQELILPPSAGKDFDQEEIIPIDIPPVGGVYYVAQRRFGSELHDLREWVTPNVPVVRWYASALYHPDRDQYIVNCWDWVCRNFAYAFRDTHELVAFAQPFRTWAVYRQDDFWHFPAEMIGFYEDAQRRGKRAKGDCEDTSFLLASLLLARTDGVYVNIGGQQELTHAWVTVDRSGDEYILETTCNAAGPWVRAEEIPGVVTFYKFDQYTVFDFTS